MKLILNTLLFLLIASSMMAQKETLVFKLSKPEASINISASDTIFKVGVRNVFTIESKGNDVITRVEAYKGKVTKIQPGLYDVVFNEGGATYLKIYTKNVKGENKIALVQQFKVQGLPEVELFLCGVKSDSAIDINHLIKVNTLEARMKSNAFKYKPTVMSFQLVLAADTFKINGDKIPFSLKNKLYEIQPGSVLSILETRVMLPNETKNIVVLPPFNVFVVETDQYSVGKRVFTNPAEE